jgi:hypothetical protein
MSAGVMDELERISNLSMTPTGIGEYYQML